LPQSHYFHGSSAPTVLEVRAATHTKKLTSTTTSQKNSKSCAGAYYSSILRKEA